MIVSDSLRYVYIGIPKAGSQSVSRWLMDNYAGSPLGYHHAWTVPAEYQDYFVFTVVRDPYERCFSAWWYRCQEPMRKEGPTYGWSFTRFMGSVLAFRERRAATASGDESSMTQKEYVDLSGAQRVVRLEATAEFGQLPFVRSEQPELPRENENRTKPRRSFRESCSGAEEQLVWDYCAEDFSAFGYPRAVVPDLPRV